MNSNFGAHLHFQLPSALWMCWVSAHIPAGWHEKGPLGIFISLEFGVIQTWPSFKSFVMSATADARGIHGMCWLGQAGASHKLKDDSAQRAESLLTQPTVLFFWPKESLPGVCGQMDRHPLLTGHHPADTVIQLCLHL